jgi:hypothetical protein
MQSYTGHAAAKAGRRTGALEQLYGNTLLELLFDQPCKP